MSTMRYEVRRTVDSEGNLIANQDKPHPGLVIGKADGAVNAMMLAKEDYKSHQARLKPVGPGCYYILDTKTGEHHSANL